MPQTEQGVSRLGWGIRFSVLLLFIAILFMLRRPDSILHPQFWAEDGTLLFHDELLRGGLTPVFEGYKGYLIVNTRLVAALTAIFPVTYAPLVYNLTAIALASLACSLFALPWYRYSIASDALRALTGIAAAGALYTQSLVDNLCNSQWYIAIAALLLLGRAKESEKRDSLFLITLLSAFSLLAALTNPVMIVTVPICLWNLARRRNPSISAAVLAGVLTQLTYSFLRGPGGSVQVPHTAAQVGHLIEAAVRASIYKVVLVSLTGPTAVDFLSKRVGLSAFLFAIAATLIWLAWLLIRLDWHKRLQACTALMVGIGSILLPLVGRKDLLNAFASIRNIPYREEQYFFVAGCMLLFLLALSVEQALRSRSGHVQACAFLAVTAGGFAENFSVPPFVDDHWSENAPKIAAWHVAETHHLFHWGVAVPLNPDPWRIQLPSSGELTVTGFPGHIAATEIGEGGTRSAVQDVISNSSINDTYVELPPVLSVNTLYRVRAAIQSSGSATISLLVHGKSSGGSMAETEPHTISNDFRVFETQIRTDDSARLCIQIKHYSGANAEFQSITVTQVD